MSDAGSKPGSGSASPGGSVAGSQKQTPATTKQAPATAKQAPGTATPGTATPGTATPDPEYLLPGQDDDEAKPEKSLNKWHNFESQYSLAVESSAVIEREAWGSQVEFLMTCIASAVGLGNIWRFPFICGGNGGCIFLIPYLIVLTIVGRPLYMLELGMGQFTSGGPVKIWECVPGFRGVGYGVTLASFFVSTFYCVIMGWAFLYLVYSMLDKFPWENQHTKFPNMNPVEVHKDPGAFFGLQHLGHPAVKETETDFYNHKGLDGPPKLHLAFALLVSWLLVWAQMVIGVSGSGKVAYFTALFPYVVLFILFGGGLSLTHFKSGLVFFFADPQWGKLGTGQAWFQAVAQCFFSLGITFGGCVTFASFNQFHHKLGRDIIIISIMDTFTSLLAGSSLFMLIGEIHKGNSSEIRKAAEGGGAGLAFVVFPAVLKAFPDAFAHFFSVMFFFMIMVLAVGSANGLAGTVVTVIGDAMPQVKRPFIVTGVCLFSYFLGLIYCCPTGAYLIDLVDRYGSELIIFMMGIFEVIGIIYVYGLKNIANDFEFMLGSRINYYWLISWAILPILLIGVFIFFLATAAGPLEMAKKPSQIFHPGAATGMGWVITFIGWAILPITLVWVIQTRKSHSCVKRIKASFFPTRKWGPQDPTIREAWRRWKKTRPVEFDITRQVLIMLRIRQNEGVLDPENYWSRVTESQYQTQNPSTVPSADVMGEDGDGTVDPAVPGTASTPAITVTAPPKEAPKADARKPPEAKK